MIKSVPIPRISSNTFDYSIKKYDDDNYELMIFLTERNFLSTDINTDINVNTKLDNVNDFKLDHHISRARTKIFEYSMCNDFDYFITLTLNPSLHDTLDLDSFIKNFSQFIRNLRKKYKTKIEYLLVPEQHKSGAYHMHGLIKGIPNEQLFKNKHGYLDWADYKKKFGYVSLSPVKNKVAVSKYITKYLTKDMSYNKDRKHKKLYYSSRGLKLPDRLKQGKSLKSDINLYLSLNDDNVYQGDYVIKKSLNESELQHLLDINILVNKS